MNSSLSNKSNMRTELLTRLASRETITNFECTLRCKDGGLKTVTVNSSVFYEGDRFVHTRCVTTDISRAKAYEMELSRAKEEAVSEFMSW